MAASKHQSSILKHHYHIWKGTEDTLLEEEKHHEKRLLPLHVSEGPSRGSRESISAQFQPGGEQEEGISSNPSSSSSDSFLGQWHTAALETSFKGFRLSGTILRAFPQEYNDGL